MALVVKNPPANAGDLKDAGSIPGLGRYPGKVNGNPPYSSCLRDPMDRGAWWATVHRVTQSWTWLKWLNMQLVDPVNWSKYYLKLFFQHLYLDISLAAQTQDQIECIISSHLTICLLTLPLSDYDIMITFSILRSLVTLCSRINILSQPCSFHHCSISHPDDLFLHQVPSHWTTLRPIHVYTSQSFPLMPK